MADFLNAIKDEQNFTYTENGAGSYKSTMSGILDLFGLGGAYRSRSNEDCIRLFKKAWAEDPTLALKCLFYLRDVRGGQGERRFFRVVLHDLAITHPEVVCRNLDNISEYGRYDDLYCLMDTPLEKDVFEFIKNQLKLDMVSKTPSLLAKWCKSENASSKETKRLGTKTRMALGISAREYRKMLSKLRAKINIVERLMSANRWEDIEFDKIPSRAGFVYRNAFAHRDIIKAKYESFMKSDDTKVNAKTLYPYEIIHQIFDNYRASALDIAVYDKYWENLSAYIAEMKLNALAVVDTSGSMYNMNRTPIEVAVSLGMLCAEKNVGPYHNHFLTFSASPRLQEIKGDNIYDKVRNLEQADWGFNTNIEACFNLMLDVAKKNHLTQNEIPHNLIIISDMEFDRCITDSHRKETLFETLEKRWATAGYELPGLIFWNVNARHNLIPMKTEGRVTYVSGFSPSLFESIVKGKSGWDLVLDKLLSKRYEAVK